MPSLQAIELSAECLSNVKFIQEKKLIGRYFDQISQDTGKYCFGVEDTLKALEMGAVEILICWENLNVQRYVLKNGSNGEEKILHLSPEQEKDVTHFQVSFQVIRMSIEKQIPQKIYYNLLLLNAKKWKLYFLRYMTSADVLL